MRLAENLKSKTNFTNLTNNYSRHINITKLILKLILENIQSYLKHYEDSFNGLMKKLLKTATLNNLNINVP